MTPRLLPFLALALLLAGCATTRPAVDGTVAATQQAERERQLRAVEAWGFEGRIAVSSNGQGGSGRIEWRQDGPRSSVVLSAPVTRQGWRLESGPGGARLEGLEGGPRTGADAGDLLREATGWDIPVPALASWLRGLAAPGSAGVPTYAANGRLQRLAQQGWTIDYTWPASGALPSRIEARRDATRVRLAIDQWTDASP